MMSNKHTEFEKSCKIIVKLFCRNICEPDHCDVSFPRRLYHCQKISQEMFDCSIDVWPEIHCNLRIRDAMCVL